MSTRSFRKLALATGILFFALSALASSQVGAQTPTVSSTASTSKEMKHNTDYIQNLKYDLNELLAVDLEPTSQPVYPPRERKSGQVIVCTKTKHDVSSNLSENALLNPSTGVVFPGAILKQDRTLAEGLPTPYTLPRGPLTIRVALPGLKDKGVATIQSPNNIAVEVAIEKIIDHWFKEVKDKEGYQPPVRAFSMSHKSYTKEQIGVELGFGAQWGNNRATLGLKTESTHELTIAYRAFRQIYYTVYIEEPEEAGAMFADSIKLDVTNMPAAQPPGFVRSVDYGRIIIVQMTTTSQITGQEAEATLDYTTMGGVKADSKLKEKYEKIAQNSSFQALVLGGGNDTAELLSGNPKQIGEAIIKGITFSKTNPAYPISYTVVDLKSRAVSEMKTTTRYIETVRTVLPDRSIMLKHRGGYVAWFTVTWKEYDDQSEKFVTRSYNSGDKTNPWDHTLWFPGDARDFVVTGHNHTGLLWDKHREKTIRYGVLDGNKKVTIKGTTLKMSITDK
jgi:thiol-activated cytolysin